MELVATIPSSLKLQGRVGKYILKKAFKNILPYEILYRKKMGFAVPLACWFRNELKDLTYNTIFSHNSNDILNRTTVERIWREHQSGLRDRSTELWTILMFRMWERTFINQ
jgi:asparagine synthase (glutamine-hydrolysing)